MILHFLSRLLLMKFPQAYIANDLRAEKIGAGLHKHPLISFKGDGPSIKDISDISFLKSRHKIVQNTYDRGSTKR